MKDQHLTRPSGRVDLDSYHVWQGSKIAEWKHVDESVKQLCAARSDANACKRRRAAEDAAAESLAKPSFRPTSRCFRTFIDDVGDAENPIKPDLFMATAKAHAGLDPNAPDPGFCTASDTAGYCRSGDCCSERLPRRKMPAEGDVCAGNCRGRSLKQ